MGRIIGVANQKGGVGKTTTVANLGAALSERGEEVVLIDLDARGDLSSYWGVSGEDLDNTVYEAIFAEDVSVADVVVDVGERGMALAPADIDLAGAEMLLGEMEFGERQRVVEEAVREVAKDYDFTLIDMPPGLELLSVAGLGAADEIIVPQECSFLALHGLQQVERSIERLQTVKPELKLCGILLTMQDRRTIHHREVIAMVREAFGEVVFETVIPRTIRLQDAAIEHQAIIEYDPRSEAAQLYRDVAEEVLKRG